MLASTFFARIVAVPPAAGTTATSSLLRRFRNAIVNPSGDHDGRQGPVAFAARTVLRARVATLDLTRRVETLGWMAHEDALARAACGDIGVVLFQPGEQNHRLALPHKLFDAMLAGLPVIAPRFATEVAAIVKATGCGELVDAADPADIAAAIALLANPARRAAMGAAGREAALTRYSWTGEAARLVALYRELTAA